MLRAKAFAVVWRWRRFAGGGEVMAAKAAAWQRQRLTQPSPRRRGAASSAQVRRQHGHAVGPLQPVSGGGAAAAAGLQRDVAVAARVAARVAVHPGPRRERAGHRAVAERGAAHGVGRRHDQMLGHQQAAAGVGGWVGVHVCVWVCG